MTMLKTTLLALALVAGTAQAQSCGTLTATGNGAPGTDVVLDLTGSTPDAFAVLAIGDTLGTTTIQIGQLATLTLDLERPFLPVAMGRTDANGDASLTIAVPSTVMMGLDLYAQGVAIDFSFMPPMPSLNFCVSNTAAFHVGP